MTIRDAADRGHADHGWLNSYHSFSFADYYAPQHMGFRSLRVINDDTVAGGGGFGAHPHHDMEIISYVLTGALRHRDSLGSESVMRAGEVQRISAGTGVMHSELNASERDPVHFLQIWIQPSRRGVKPRYDEKSFAKAQAGQWHLVASETGRDGSLGIHQDAEVYLAKLGQAQRVHHPLRPGRHAWVQVAAGEVTLNGHKLRAGDGAALSDEPGVEVTGLTPAQVLLFDLN